MKTPPKAEELQTESDVEQKFAWPLLTSLRPNGLGFPEAEVFTKPNIQEFVMVIVGQAKFPQGLWVSLHEQNK